MYVLLAILHPTYIGDMSPEKKNDMPFNVSKKGLKRHMLLACWYWGNISRYVARYQPNTTCWAHLPADMKMTYATKLFPLIP